MGMTADDRLINELLPVSRNWRDDALCPQTDPDAFFPEKGGGTRAAKRICAMCKVKTQCAIFAVDNDIREGIWGGMTLRERRLWADDNNIEWGGSADTVTLPDPIVIAAANDLIERLAG